MTTKAQKDAQEEYWVTKDGKRIAVGDLDLTHLRNIVRNIISRRRYAELCLKRIMEMEDVLGKQYQKDLADPNCYFSPLGRFGGPGLAKEFKK
jgi:hypothetical protein